MFIWWVKAQLLQEIKQLQAEKASVIQELDLLKSEIRQQREGKTVVSMQKQSLENDLFNIESILEATKKHLDYYQSSYVSLNAKQKERIKDLQEKINDKLRELYEYSKVELIDKKKENQLIKKDLINKKSALVELEYQIKELQNNIEHKNNELLDKQLSIQKKEEHLAQLQEFLNKKHNSLLIYENRLNKMKEDLFSKTDNG